MNNDINFSLADPWSVMCCLVPIVLNNIRGCVVEIGIGLSTHILVSNAERFGVKYYGCDQQEKRCDRYRSYFKYRNAKIIHSISLDFMEAFSDNPAIVLLDGDHRYKTVSKEVEFFSNLLLPGGVMFLHDTLMNMKWIKDTNVKKSESRMKYTAYLARRDIENNRNFWSITFPYTAWNCGLTVAMKKQTKEEFYGGL